MSVTKLRSTTNIEEKIDVEATNKLRRPLIGSKLYDILKLVAQVILPLIGVVCFLLGSALAVGIVVAISFTLGILLRISQGAYYRGVALGGELVVEEADGTPSFRLRLNATPDDLAEKVEVRFRVVKERK
jgi:Putative phage holin Dp-1